VGGRVRPTSLSLSLSSLIFPCIHPFIQQRWTKIISDLYSRRLLLAVTRTRQRVVVLNLGNLLRNLLSLLREFFKNPYQFLLDLFLSPQLPFKLSKNSYLSHYCSGKTTDFKPRTQNKKPSSAATSSSSSSTTKQDGKSSSGGYRDRAAERRAGKQGDFAGAEKLLKVNSIPSLFCTVTKLMI